MPFLKEIFGFKNLAGDVRTTVVSMLTVGAIAVIGPIVAAIWKSAKAQPVPWTVLILIGVAGIALLSAATIKLVKAEKSRQPAAPVQPAPVVYADPIPAQPDFSDPVWDQFFLESSLSSWRESLIKRGQPLMEWWTMRLDYPDKQRRESESINWLSELNRFSNQHLTDEQKQRLMQDYHSAMKMDKRYEFNMALKNAGTQPGTEDHDLAFGIACKVKLLERFRSEPTPPRQQAKLSQERERAVNECFERAAQLLKKPTVYQHGREFQGFFKAEPYKMESNEEVIKLCNLLMKAGHKHPFERIKSHVLESEMLDFLRWGNVHHELNFGKNPFHYLKGAYEWNHKVKGRPDKQLGLQEAILAELENTTPPPS
ncbi:MAG: hypothetical protein DME33_11105 [Verrucomicrobia bacterium]|nr:MAG: hypothetical protein DME33_11105 [Verrucomicrobiota bacterium]